MPQEICHEIEQSEAERHEQMAVSERECEQQIKSSFGYDVAVYMTIEILIQACFCRILYKYWQRGLAKQPQPQGIEQVTIEHAVDI